MFDNIEIFNNRIEIKSEEETKAFGLALAKKLGDGKRVVTILPDGAERYFSTALFE